MPTKQEMFNRAYIGLARQGFVKCEQTEPVYNGSKCLYRKEMADGTVCRCAFGHVDTSLDQQAGDVYSLATSGVGLAATLSQEELFFAYQLQRAHDSSTGPGDMKQKLETLRVLTGLYFPYEAHEAIEESGVASPPIL